MQRQQAVPSQPNFLGPYCSMSDRAADAYILGGIATAVEGGTWRWAFDKPLLRFYLTRTANLKFAMEFAIPEATFADTGPVTLSIFVNEKPLGKQRYDKPGQLKLEMPVPADLLRAEAVNTVAMEPDKVWVSKTDGVKLGFILTGAGFRD